MLGRVAYADCFTAVRMFASASLYLLHAQQRVEALLVMRPPHACCECFSYHLGIPLEGVHAHVPTSMGVFLTD